MVIDCHVHASALLPEMGRVSPALYESVPFRFIRWKLELGGEPAVAHEAMAQRLIQTVEQATELDAAVILAFDAVYTEAGALDEAATHLYVSNDYAMALCRRSRRLLFGASVHPYRKDAVAEIERCVKNGAALLKWLPLTQRFDPMDRRCIPVYEALAHHKLPLLCHTGGEETLPILKPEVASPAILVEALRRGVTVIAAHCGTRSRPWRRCHVPDFARMAREYEHLYGDTSGLTVPNRAYAWPQLLGDEVVRGRLVHGSDWPILSLPPLRYLGLSASLALLRERNWMRRDVLIKRKLGLDNGYWQRAGQVLKLR